MSSPDAPHPHSAPKTALLPILGIATVGGLAVLSLLLVRGMTYRGTVAWSAGWPAPMQLSIEAVSEYGILGLMGLFGLVAWRSRRLELTRLARGIAAGFGVIGAYLASELIKVMVEQLRPCRNFAVQTITACPDPSDWSWPSNHATIAMGIAVGVLAMSLREGMLALPFAGLIGLSRVLVGVHYFHDVLAGALLALLVVIIATRWGTPLTERFLHWSRRVLSSHPR